MMVYGIGIRGSYVLDKDSPGEVSGPMQVPRNPHGLSSRLVGCLLEQSCELHYLELQKTIYL